LCFTNVERLTINIGDGPRRDELHRMFTSVRVETIRKTS
jgi:hypothetical protein